jgi:predicted dehydrogenase
VPGVLTGGVIGFGNVGQHLTRHINGRLADRARIVAACNRGAAGCATAREAFGLAATQDVDEFFSKDLQFVVIASTSIGHAEQVVNAAGRGLAVFCEKPIALSLSDADRMIDAVERAGVVNAVNYSMRYIDAYQKIREMVRAGTMGEILAIRHSKTRAFGLYGAGARHRAVMEPQESGGWIVHHACHDLDFLSWINGAMTRVYARTATTVPGGRSEEVVLGLVDFANGAVGAIGDSVCCIRDHYTQIIGSRASLVLTGEKDQTVLRLHREGAAEAECIPARDEKEPGGGIDHFIECLAAGRQSANSLRSARHSLAAALAMRESALRGVPVEVPPEPGAS